ncbi:MAG: AI-2E family transporter [Gammaproteobacteria bacterium]|uniref:AI-2E family transporter n=1 Tax=Pseudomaricurvus alcaniphilus TaxID=1166482 RepID=UPI00140E78C7|nr:AI-2E family transporter [Pseudomaricurvus alcaniphilus]MBR9912824.1 AI-2E family transporter [Gammaproteobacteria bacterium]NHN37803.1 AI-2E family transporter [Pseudomaricurvus alcaniphilus]
MLRVIRGWVDRYFGEEEAVLLALLLIGSMAVILTMGNILAPAITGLIVAFLLEGLVDKMTTWRLPRWLAVAIVTLLLMTLLAIFFFYLMPVLWQQMARLVGEIPRMLTEWQQLMLLLPQKYPQLVSEQQVREIMNSVGSELRTLGQGVLTFSVANLPVLLGVLIYMILLPILVFFFLKDSDQILRWLGSFLPSRRPVMNRIWQEMNDQVTNYVRGKVIEILLVGIVSYVSFFILGLNYALLLGVAVGFSVVIPYIGAAVVTIPVLLIGFLQWGIGSDFYALLIVYAIIQALDGNVLVPLLFSEAVNLHPVAIILAVLVFGGLWGFWGVFFAIPLATLVKAVLNSWPVAIRETCP